MKVLVVEDQQIDRLIIRKQLSPDFKVTTLSSATEAKAFSMANAFDIAVLNVMLREDMDGLKLLRDLRSLTSHPFTAFAITCHADDRRCRILLNNGFAALLPKPFERAEFERLLTLFNVPGAQHRDRVFNLTH